MAVIDHARSLCAEERWAFHSITNGRQGTPSKIVRRLDNIGVKDFDGITTFLAEYTSARNSVPSIRIVEPLVDGQIQAGTWTNGQLDIVRDPNGKPVILQTLTIEDGNYLGTILVESTCQYRTYRINYFDVAELPVLPTSSSGVTYQMSNVTRDDASGTYTLYIERRERLHTVVAEHTAEVKTSSSTSRVLHQGVRDGDLDEDGVAVALPDMTLATGHIKRRIRSKNADCTQDIQSDDETVVDQTATDTSANEQSTITTTKHTEGTAATVGTVGDGEARQVSNSPTPAGNYQTAYRLETVKDQTITEVERGQSTAEEIRDTITHTASATEVQTPTIVTGIIQIVSNAATEFKNRWRTVVQTITAQKQQKSGSFADYDGTIYWWWGRNVTDTDYAAVISTANLDATTQNSLTCTYNRFGLNDYLITKKPAPSSRRSIWSGAVGLEHNEQWIETEKIYSEKEGRERLWRRECTQNFHLNVRLAWNAAQADVSDVAHVTKRKNLIESMGDAWISYIPQSAIIYGAWEEDETGVQ